MSPAFPKTVGSRPARPSAEGGGAALRTVAVIDEGPDRLGVVIAALPGPGEALRLVETRAFAPGERPALRALLREKGVDLVIRIAPAAQTMARVTTVPEGAADRAALADALALVAESELPGSLPWYRRAGGVVRPAPGGSGGDWALLVGWHPSGASGPDPAAAALEGFRQVWTTEAVGLARLLRSGAADGGPAWIASVDDRTGVASLAVAAGGRGVVRTLRVPADAQAAREATREAIQEALASIEAEASQAAGMETADGLILSPGLRTVVFGQPRDAAWLSRFGVAAAVAEVFAEPDPAARALFNLHAVEPRQRLGLVRAAAAWLSAPGRAAAVIVLCLAALLLVPLGVAYARHQMLRRQMEGVTGLEDRLAAADEQSEFYAALRERRWPMTKLIADVATCAPVGVTLEILEVNQGSAVAINGVAESNPLVNEFRTNLLKTRVFDSVTVPSTRPGVDGVLFQLEARVSPTGAIYRSDPIDDFAAEPLAKRLYGDDYEPPEGDDYDDEEEERPRAAAPRAPAAPAARASSSSSSRSAPRPTASAGAARPSPSASSVKVPEPLSDEQIGKLDRTQAMLEFAKRKQAAANPEIDAATRQRLLDESDKARQRMQQLANQTMGGTGS